MKGLRVLKCVLVGGVSLAMFGGAAAAKTFDIPNGDLAAALVAYMKQSNVEVVYLDDAVRGHKTKGAKGNYTEIAALTQLLRGTGLTAQAMPASNAIGIVEQQAAPDSTPAPMKVAQAQPMAALAAAAAAPAIETVVVTAEKKSENIQQVPIAISAFSQEQLTARQIAGGPDLVKEVPNLTFSKTNFTGYNLQIRGIGTQAISVTTDPAVAVSLNGTPFIRNHFFEQEFYDLQDAEVLRGPQGTLYGRNATGGVVNITSAKPTDEYEGMGSVDVGNYENRRLEAMLNIPIVDDKLDFRVAGEWTKRDGYVFDEETNTNVDGRDLWSGRASLLFHPFKSLTANFVWEHFQEDDDRLRSGKQLCTRSNVNSVVNPSNPSQSVDTSSGIANIWLSQGCSPGSLYGPDAFETPNAGAVPFIGALETLGYYHYITPNTDPYSGQMQSTNLRTIASLIQPVYKAKNDTLEANIDFDITPELTLTSQTGYNHDYLWSSEDYNRYNTTPGIFQDIGTPSFFGPPPPYTLVGDDGEFCDPQLGCSTRFVSEDLAREHARQFYQEMRLASHFDGPFNFLLGGNFLSYDTQEDYFVFSNALTLFSEWNVLGNIGVPDAPHISFASVNPNSCGPGSTTTAAGAASQLAPFSCVYIDPNPITSVNGQGHNYFLSHNPYQLQSKAAFGEAYYQVTPDVKLTGGLRWTDDSKQFEEYPSLAGVGGQGLYQGSPISVDGSGIVDQQWKEWTGRANVTWTPALDFTDQSLFYATISRGYKGGGANPPGVSTLPTYFELYPNTLAPSPSDATHPPTFKPEFITAFEVGTKDSLADNTITLDGDIFYYDYRDYQISQIVDRTSVNLNFNAKLEGAEAQATWEPLPGLAFNLNAGYENSSLDKGSQAIDLMDRTAGTPGWMVVKPYVTQTSNCILPTAVVYNIIANGGAGSGPSLGSLGNVAGDALQEACVTAYVGGQNPDTSGNTNFNPATAPNGGEGFYKNLSGNKLPNTPPFTLSAGSQYSMPLGTDWAATLRGDFYWQGDSYARVFNDRPYDDLHGYTNVNLSLAFANQDNWLIMFYVKNVFDTTAITGAFLNSDDSGLTTNVFLTDPRLFGVRVTKNF